MPLLPKQNKDGGRVVREDAMYGAEWSSAQKQVEVIEVTQDLKFCCWLQVGCECFHCRVIMGK